MASLRMFIRGVVMLCYLRGSGCGERRPTHLTSPYDEGALDRPRLLQIPGPDRAWGGTLTQSSNTMERLTSPEGSKHLQAPPSSKDTNHGSYLVRGN